MRMSRWVTGPGGRGDVVVRQLATGLPLRAGCGDAGLAHHAIRCPTLYARTAAPLHVRMHVHSRDRVCMPRGVCTEQGWAVCRGVLAAGRDARSAPDCVCASWGDRMMRGRDVCLSAEGTAAPVS